MSVVITTEEVVRFIQMEELFLSTNLLDILLAPTLFKKTMPGQLEGASVCTLHPLVHFKVEMSSRTILPPMVEQFIFTSIQNPHS